MPSDREVESVRVQGRCPPERDEVECCTFPFWRCAAHVMNRRLYTSLRRT